MNFLTTVEMSEIWGISSRRISLLCSNGRIQGAVKKCKKGRRNYSANIRMDWKR